MSKGNEKPTVSIIVPVYNAGKYLGECLDAMIAQTFESFEAILVNDGSSDNSAEICDQYTEIDSRFKVIHKENEGPSATRNRGIKESKGDFIVFCDADDILTEGALEEMHRVLTTYNTELVITGYAKFNRSSDPLWDRRVLSKYSLTILQSKMELGSIFLVPYTNLFGVSIWAKMYRADIIRENGILFPQDIHYEEDCCFNLQYFNYVNTTAVLRNTMYLWRQHKSSLTKVYKVETYDYLVNGYNAKVRFLESVDMEENINRLNNIFLLVIISQYKKIIYTSMSKKERLKVYEGMLAKEETKNIFKTCDLSKYRLTRELTLASRKNNPKKIDRILILWYIKAQLDSLKKFLKGIRHKIKRKIS